MENELYHYRLKGDRNGFTRIKGYTPIGEKAKGALNKVKTAVSKVANTVKDKITSEYNESVNDFKNADTVLGKVGAVYEGYAKTQPLYHVSQLVEKALNKLDEKLLDKHMEKDSSYNQIAKKVSDAVRLLDSKTTKEQPKGKTFDTSTGIDEPKELTDFDKEYYKLKKEVDAAFDKKKEDPHPRDVSDSTDSKTYAAKTAIKENVPFEAYGNYTPDEVEAVVNEWNQRYEEIGLKPPAIPDEELRELLANKRRQMQHSMPRPADEMKGILMHHGIPKQKWGVRHGPPYPLDWDDKSAAQKKASPDKLRPSRSKDGMTTEEIEAANRRMRAENEYARLTSERTPAPAPSKWEVADGIASQAKAGSDYLLKWYDASRPKEKIRRGMADTRPDYEHMTTKEIADEVAWHKNYKELMKDDPYPKSKDTIREILQTLGTVTAFTSAATSLAKVYSDLKKK